MTKLETLNIVSMFKHFPKDLDLALVILFILSCIPIVLIPPYKVDTVYAPEYEAGLIWKDPDVDIPWPNTNPILSPKDQQLRTLRELVARGDVR